MSDCCQDVIAYLMTVILGLITRNHYQKELMLELLFREQEKDKLVAEVIRYVLFKTHQNSGCPIKREELTQIVTRGYRNRYLPAAVINEAQEKLTNVLGYELKELQRSRPSSASKRPSHQSKALVSRRVAG